MFDSIMSAIMRPSRYIEHGWCQRSSAKNIHGAPVGADTLAAYRFSIAGALERATLFGNYTEEEAKLFLHAIHHIMKEVFELYTVQGTISEWEDGLRILNHEGQALVFALSIAAEEIVEATREAALEIDY